MTVADSTSSPSGLRHRSQRPAKASTGEPSAAVNRCGILPHFSPVHSKNPEAGMMQPAAERLAHCGRPHDKAAQHLGDGWWLDEEQDTCAMVGEGLRGIYKPSEGATVVRTTSVVLATAHLPCERKRKCAPVSFSHFQCQRQLSTAW